MKNYPLYKTDLYENIRDFVEAIGEKYTDDIAFSYKTKPHDTYINEISYRTLVKDVKCLATYLISMNLQGKHIALIGKYSYGWVCTYLASMASSCVIVPLDPDWTAQDLADTVKNAECKALFCSESVYDSKAKEIMNVCKDIKITAIIDDCVNNNLKDMINTGYKMRNSGDTSYENTVIDNEALAVLVYTSGTTGKGKGVMLSQKALLSNIYGGLQLIEVTKKTIAALPPHHTFGSTIAILGHLSFGTNTYISSGIKYLPKEIKEQKPGHLILVPLFLEAFYRKIMSYAKDKGKSAQLARVMKVTNGLNKAGIDVRRLVFKSILANFGGELRTVICGGAPLNQEIVDTFDALGINILNGYGITECSPLISANRNKQKKIASVGMPIPTVDVKIANPDENGEGEICVKGDSVMIGYYDNEQATADAFDEDGYFRTGDYGKLDSDGWIYITGRLKNLIILSNGKNVYPEEIENDLSSIEGIVDIVVYEGISRRGEKHNAIVAEIYPDENFFKENNISDIQGYFKSNINEYNRKAVAYKKVDIVKIRDKEFPKNTLRKITRFTLDKTID